MEGFTPQVDVMNWDRFVALGHLSVVCPQDALLNGFHFEFSQGGRWIRFRYTCCNAIGVDDTLVPIGLSSGSSSTDFDVTAISDFDGTFEGKGVPKMGRSKAATKALLRSIKTPRRPRAPRVPRLDTFRPEEPTYAAECIDYSELWTSIQESYKDADGTVTPHMNNLKAEPVYDLPETNPCEVAGGITGIRGKIGGGDGRSTGEKMSYEELDQCSARVINRELAEATREYTHSMVDAISDVASE